MNPSNKRELGKHKSDVFCICIQGNHIISGGEDNQVLLWHLKDKRYNKILGKH